MAKTTKPFTRVFMSIKRGLTDTTSVCVWPWEKYILEQVHGGNAQAVTLDEMCDLGKPARVLEQKMIHDDVKPGPGLRQQYEAMLVIDKDRSPLEDPAQEWARLLEVYGMDKDKPVPVAELVYGSYRQFRQAMKEFAAGRVPDFLSDEAIDAEGEDDVPPADMTMAQLREKCRELKIGEKGKTRGELEDLLTEALALAAA